MNASHHLSRLRTLLYSACAYAAIALPAGGSDLAPGDPVRSGVSCVETFALAPLAGIDDAAGGSAQKNKSPVSAKAPLDKRNKRLRPMTRKELRGALRALEPIRLKTGEWTIRATTYRSEVDYDRLQVVYTDAVGLLTFLQAEDALIRLSELPGSDPQLEAEMAASFDRLGDCLEGRYEPWGGDETVAEMLGVVDDLRLPLESLILEQLERRRAPEEPR